MIFFNKLNLKITLLLVFLLIKYENEFFTPVIFKYSETRFGGDFETNTDYEFENNTIPDKYVDPHDIGYIPMNNYIVPSDLSDSGLNDFTEPDPDFSSYHLTYTFSITDGDIQDVFGLDDIWYCSDYGFGYDENYKQFPCKCKSKNCCGYIVRAESRWRINKKFAMSNKNKLIKNSK